MVSAAKELWFDDEFAKKLFWSLAFSIGLVTFSYLYLVNQTVVNIVERKASESKTSELSNTLNTLEFSYISLESTITLEHAAVLGLSDSAEKIFLARESIGPAVALR